MLSGISGRREWPPATAPYASLGQLVSLEIVGETARVYRPGRWCGGRMAAGGARAAETDAGDRLARQRFAQPEFAECGRVPPGTERNRLCRGPKCSDRVPLGGRAL